MTTPLAGKKVVVLGLARSGLAATKFLLDQGAEVFATDRKSRENIGRLDEIASLEGVKLYLGEHPLNILEEAELMVISPGIKEDIPFVQAAKERKLKIISELELAASHINKPLIAVTGTNGKTTTTTLIGKILEANGTKAVVAGNIGNPVSAEVDNINAAAVGVLEVSSFQLERSPAFHPQGALILNITPDHQDRYPSIAEYRQAKAQLLKNLDASDWAILNYDDPICRMLASSCAPSPYYFSRQTSDEKGTFVFDDWIFFQDAQGAMKKILPLDEIVLEGLHNRENFLAATLAASLWGVKTEAIQQVARTFRGLPHRLETVATIDGVRYVNDSKGTNMDAVKKSLQGFGPKSVVLIMGGRDKGGDFPSLKELIKNKVITLILIGEASNLLAEVFKGTCPVRLAGGMKEAVNEAAAIAQTKEVVLLSPGCTSWDMFSDYQERGDAFKKAALALEGEKHG